MSTALDHLMTTREAGERLGVKPRRVRQFIDAGDLPSVTVGAQHLIAREDVEKLAKKRRCPPRPGTITPDAAAARLGVPAGRVRHLFRTGRLKGYRHRGKIYLYPASLKACAAQAP